MAGKKERNKEAPVAVEPAPVEKSAAEIATERVGCPTFVLLASEPGAVAALMAALRVQGRLLEEEQLLRAFEMWEEAHRG